MQLLATTTMALPTTMEVVISAPVDQEERPDLVLNWNWSKRRTEALKA